MENKPGASAQIGAEYAANPFLFKTLRYDRSRFHSGDPRPVHALRAYKSMPPAMTDLMAGQIDFLFVHVASSQGFLKSGQLRPLAFSLSQRSQRLTEMPTVAETPGFAGYEVTSWVGIVGPAGMPRDIVERLNTELRKSLAKELAGAVGVSPFHLQRRFKEAFGVSPRGYQEAHRVEAVKTSLKNGSGVTDAVYAAGSVSVSRFYEKPHLGMKAREYRAGGKGQAISFCCSVGKGKRRAMAAF